MPEVPPADPLPRHARPGLPIPERAARVELAIAQEDRAPDRRRVIAEALEAAVAQALAERVGATRVDILDEMIGKLRTMLAKDRLPGL